MRFLQLIRYKNLLIIIATMIIIRYGLLLPMLTSNYDMLGVTMELQFSLFNFILLVLATVFISASGYIINDYFDVNSDMMNKPDSVIIGKHINRRFAMSMHWIFNILGIACGVVVSFAVKLPQFSFIFIFISGLLWFYSTTFSKEPFIGNLIIAVLVGLVPLIEAIFELIPLNIMYKNYLQELYVSFEALLFWSLGYALFAFLTTLVREMVKDIEDLEGDAAYGRNTIPIAFGIQTAKYVTISIFIVTISSLVFVNFAYLDELFAKIYLLFGIVVPLIISLVLFMRADSAPAYHRVSTFLKIIMIFGLLYIVSKNFI